MRKFYLVYAERLPVKYQTPSGNLPFSQKSQKLSGEPSHAGAFLQIGQKVSEDFVPFKLIHATLEKLAQAMG